MPILDIFKRKLPSNPLVNAVQPSLTRQSTDGVSVSKFDYEPTTFGVLSPDEVGKFTPKSLTLNQIKNMTASQILKTLIISSSDMDGAVNLWVNLVATNFTLDTEDNEAKSIIEDFIAFTEKGGPSFQSKFHTAAYNRYVEGGLFLELYFDESGETPLDIALPSPYSLRYMRTEDINYKEYYLIGQGNTSKDFVVLLDKANPNPLIEWEPTNKDNTKPWGRSSISSNIYNTVAIMELTTMIMEYVRGQAFPKGIVSVLSKPFTDAGLAADEVLAKVEEAEEEISKNISSSDLTQALVTSVECMYTLMGAIGKSTLDGVQMITEMLEKSLRRGYRLPPSLYGTGESSALLGDNSSRINWQAFSKLVKPERTVIENAFGNLFRVILRHYGNTSECKPKFDDSDTELERIIAEKDNLEIQAYSLLIHDGVTTEDEIRDVLKATNPKFDNLTGPAPGRVALPTPADPENTDDNEGDDDDE